MIRTSRCSLRHLSGVPSEKAELEDREAEDTRTSTGLAGSTSRNVSGRPQVAVVPRPRFQPTPDHLCFPHIGKLPLVCNCRLRQKSYRGRGAHTSERGGNGMTGFKLFHPTTNSNWQICVGLWEISRTICRVPLNRERIEPCPSIPCFVDCYAPG